MPALSVPVDDQTLAAMGEWKAALREVQREYEKVSRRIFEDMRTGKIVNPVDAATANALQIRADAYRAKERERKEIMDKSSDAAVGKIVRLLNTHSPTGSIRSLVSGNANASNMQMVAAAVKTLGSVMQKTGLPRAGGAVYATGKGFEDALIAAGPYAAAAAMGGKFGAHLYDTVHDSAVTAAKTDLQTYQHEYSFQRQFRFKPLDGQQRADIDRYMGAARDYSSPKTGVFHEFFFGAEHHAMVRKMSRDVAEYWWRNRGRMGEGLIGQTVNWKDLVNSEEVTRAFKYSDIGKDTVWSWLKSQTVDRITGEREAEKQLLAQELARKRMAARENVLETAVRDTREDPSYRVDVLERTRVMKASTEFFQVQKFLQWNPY